MQEQWSTVCTFSHGLWMQGNSQRTLSTDLERRQTIYRIFNLSSLKDRYEIRPRNCEGRPASVL